MAFESYHRNVVATVGSDNFTIPVGNMLLRNDPVSRAGSFALELFNSSMVQRIDGWLVRVEFSYDEIALDANVTIREFIEAVLDDGICVIDFDPDDEFVAEDRTITFVLESAPEAVVASFSGRARNRTSAFQLVSKTWLSAPLEWITL